jgi:hypothetical protein
VIERKLLEVGCGGGFEAPTFGVMRPRLLVISITYKTRVALKEVVRGVKESLLDS